MKEKKKTAKRKTRWESTVDLVDCWIDDEITKDELIEKLMTLVGKPIIKISDIEYRVIRWKENLYLESRQEFQDGCKDIWVQVEDLTDLRVYEYNALVDELNKYYPDYPLERLESRFV